MDRKSLNIIGSWSGRIPFLTVFLETGSCRAISRTDCRCTKYARLIRPIVSTLVVLRLGDCYNQPQ
jgi:hypothetical protein